MTRDIPILFSAPMVQAILEGRKTQTRRALKPQPHEWQVRVMDVLPPSQDEETGEWGQVETVWSGPLVPGMCEPDHEVWHPLKGVRWRVGDRLWVKETWAARKGHDSLAPHAIPRETFCPIWYRDDPSDEIYCQRGRWRSPIHMPRWASRITLLVKDVRVQRLQDIREADARAEGVEPILVPPDGGSAPYIEGFRDIWTTINGPGSWDANPWVAAISFERVT